MRTEASRASIKSAFFKQSVHQSTFCDVAWLQRVDSTRLSNYLVLGPFLRWLIHSCVFRSALFLHWWPLHLWRRDSSLSLQYLGNPANSFATLMRKDLWHVNISLCLFTMAWTQGRNWYCIRPLFTMRKIELILNYIFLWVSVNSSVYWFSVVQNFKYLDYSVVHAKREVEFILFQRDFESDQIRWQLIDNWRREALGTSPFIPHLRV